MLSSVLALVCHDYCMLRPVRCLVCHDHCMLRLVRCLVCHDRFMLKPVCCLVCHDHFMLKPVRCLVCHGLLSSPPNKVWKKYDILGFSQKSNYICRNIIVTSTNNYSKYNRMITLSNGMEIPWKVTIGIPEEKEVIPQTLFRADVPLEVA